VDEETYLYMCTNDDCVLNEQLVRVVQGSDPVCSFCGWFMSADIDGGPNL